MTALTLVPITLDQLDLLAVGDLAAAGRSIGTPVPPDFADGQWIWQNFAHLIRTEPELAWWHTQYLICEDGSIVGHARLFPPTRREAQIGWHVDPIRRNRGTATHAAETLADIARQRPDVDRLVALINHQNVASQRVAAKAGFLADGEQRHRFGWTMLRYVLPLRD